MTGCSAPDQQAALQPASRSPFAFGSGLADGAPYGLTKLDVYASDRAVLGFHNRILP